MPFGLEVVSAIAAAVGVDVVLVAPVLGHLGLLSPQQFASLVSGVTLSAVTVGVAFEALGSVLQVHITGTGCGLAVACFRNVAYRLGTSTHDTSLRRYHLTGGSITAISFGALGPFGQLASGCIAARVGTKIRQTTITFFSLVNNTIATVWLENLARFVEEAVIDAVLERLFYLVDRAGGPESRTRIGGRWSHDAIFLWTDTLASVVFHAKVVAHFVSNGGGYQSRALE